MKIKWSQKEINLLKYYYVDMGLSLSEFYEDFKLKYPLRTIVSVRVKIKKMKLRHSKEQILKIKSRLNSGEKNAMYGKVGPNKGLNKQNSERINNSSKKISETRKRMFKEGLLNVSGDKNGMWGKEPWLKGKTKYTDNRLMESSKKISLIRKEKWNLLTQDEKDKKIGELSLAANKAKKDTKIEIIVLEKLEKMSIRYIKNYKCDRYIFDFYLVDYNFVIECQGDYWHGNTEYFSKLNEVQLKNIERDRNKIKYLNENKIKSLFLWENEIYRYREKLEEIILTALHEN
jgi:G:T-mismatch repair DNA endonuclease (very short patch repair protein)